MRKRFEGIQPAVFVLAEQDTAVFEGAETGDDISMVHVEAPGNGVDGDAWVNETQAVNTLSGHALEAGTWMTGVVIADGS
jgi:hypothetical protein